MKTIHKKIIGIFFLIFINYCSSQIIAPEGYEVISDTLNISGDIDIYNNIIPDKKFDYWKVVRKFHQQEERIIFEKGNPTNLKHLKDNSPKRGFSDSCPPEDCYTYITTNKNGIAKYITTDKELKNFIGYIDNLSEAILLASTFHFYPDDSSKFGNLYFIGQDYIYLYLSKPTECSETRESFSFHINRKNQEVEVKSNGVFYKIEYEDRFDYPQQKIKIYKSDKCRS